MKYALVLLISMSAPVWCQTAATGTASTSGSCSPANTGNGNTFTIKCGIGQEQGQKMLAILNKILANQLNPDTVMAKLDDILGAIHHIQIRQGWPELTQDQLKHLTTTLSAFPGQTVNIAMANQDTNKTFLARQLRTSIERANWKLTIGAQAILMSEPPTGIYIAVKDNTPAAVAFVNSFADIFGRAAVTVEIKPKLDTDISVVIYDSPISVP